MIQPARPEDAATLTAITAATGVFKPADVEVLGELLDAYHTCNYSEYGHSCVTARGADGGLTGFSYFGPAEMTDRSWYLYWLVVDPKKHGLGIGSALLSYTEEAIRDAGGRLLVVETSGKPSYAGARQFYIRHGYQTVACVPDFYADGDDEVILIKRLGD